MLGRRWCLVILLCAIFVLVTSGKAANRAQNELLDVPEEVLRNDNRNSVNENDEFDLAFELNPFRGSDSGKSGLKCPKFEEFLACGCQKSCDDLGHPLPSHVM